MRQRYFAMLALALGLSALAPIGGSPPARAAVADLQPGVSVRLNDLSAVTPTTPEHQEHPGLKLISVMAPWRVLEPTRRQLDPAAMQTMEENIQDARTGGYKILLRIMAGRSQPDWLVSDPAVTKIRLLGTDVNAPDYCSWHDVVVPWDATLRDEYTWLMQQIGAWLGGPDGGGAGGTRGDHIFAIPISMPSFQGTEMHWNYGAPAATCPTGTEGEGQDLADTNEAAWDGIDPGTFTPVAQREDERRSLTKEAWRTAIDVQMAALPADVHSSLAYGALFGDQQARAIELAREMVPRYRDRLWSMLTNLQPAVFANGALGTYRQWCRKCHEVMMEVSGARGLLGFQTASTNINDTTAKFRAAVEEGLGTYGMRFLETQPDNVDRNEPYLLVEPDNVQARIRAMNHARTSSTSVVCDPVTIGHATSCTASVSDVDTGAKIIPSGAQTVSWAPAGAFSPATCLPDGTGFTTSCSVTYTPSVAGTQPVTATYRGDSNHALSEHALQLQVARRTTQTDVVCDGASTPVGVATTCTATVTDTSPGPGESPPAGQVSWSSDGVGSFDRTSCTLAAGTGSSASCAVSYTGAGIGNPVVAGQYQGSARHDGSAADTSTRIVKRGTATSVSCDSPVFVGSASTCTATVTDTDAGTPTPPGGTVTWSGGTGFSSTSCTPIGTGAQSSCSVTYTPSTAGTRTLVADYGGDATHLSSGGSSPVTASVRQTSTSVACETSVVVGSAATCTATVTDTDGGGPTTPGGTVNWSAVGQGTFSATSCAPAGSGATSSCSVTFTPSAAGTPTVTAAYGGDQRHSSSSGSTQINGNARQTSTSVECETPVLVGTPTACTATVTDTDDGAALTPAGQVAWTTDGNGSFTSATCSLSGAGGVAGCTVQYTPTAAGTHAVAANFPGSQQHGASSGSTRLTVAARTTSTSVVCETPVPVGTAATCTASVRDTDAGPGITPAGAVSWSHSGTGALSSSSCTLAGTGGVATCSVTYTRSTSGSDAVTAEYGGDGRHSGSGGDATVVTAKRATTTSVDCGAPAPVGSASTCTVTVTDTDTGAGSTPGGSVAWSSDGGGTLGSSSCALAGSGDVATCSVTYTGSGVGSDILTATFPGDVRHVGSESQATAESVLRATTTSVRCDTPVLAGSTSNCTATVTDVSGGSQDAPGGTVQWSTNGTGTFSSGTCTLPTGSGTTSTCTVTYRPSSGGPHGVTADYSGDAEHGSSTGTSQLGADQRQTTTSVGCASPVSVDSSTTCTATVTDTSPGDAITPTGAVHWFSGGNGEFADDACILLAGSGATATCSMTYTPSGAGVHPIGATYGGTGIHATSDGGAQVTATSPQQDIALRSSAFAANPVASEIVIPRPAGAVAGDVMVAVVAVRANPTVTPPSGWATVLTTASGSDLRQRVFTRVVGASEPTSYRWAFNQSRAASGAILAYSGVSTASPVDSSSGGIGTSTSIVAPSATATLGGSMVIGAFSIANGATVTQPAGMTERGEVASGSKIRTEVADAVQAAVGATGSKTAVAGSSGANVGQLIVLRPASGGPAPNREPTFDQNLPDRTDAAGAAITLSARATDPEGDPLRYAAAGLPAGLSIDASSGLISGTIACGAATGSPYSVSVTVSDDGGASVGATDTFIWTVTSAGSGGSIAFRSASTGANNVGTSVVIPVPAGLQAGDVLVAVVHAKSSPTVATPAGWTQVTSAVNGSNMRQYVYSRVATGSEPASYTWTLNETRAVSGAIVAYSGVSTTDPIATVGSAGLGTTASITAPSATSAFNGAMIVGAFGINHDATIAPPPGMTERGEIVSASRLRTEVSDLVLSSAGPTGTKVATAARAAANIGQLIVLRPAG